MPASEFRLKWVACLRLEVQMPDGTRAYGRMADADLLARAEETELVGGRVDLVSSDDDPNVNIVKA